jgi:hypothetical protein
MKHNDKNLVFEVNNNNRRVSQLLRVVGSPVPSTINRGTWLYLVRNAHWVEGQPGLVQRWVGEARLRPAQLTDSIRYRTWLGDVERMRQQQEIVIRQIRREEDEQRMREGRH